MKLVTYAQSQFELNYLKDQGIEEVIISCQDLSRTITNSFEDMLELLESAKRLGLKVILEWDILIVESDFKKYTELFFKIPTENVQVIRIQDTGVLEFVLDKSQLPVQLILENGNHNLVGLLKWEEYIGARLDRLVLSNELNSTLLKEYRTKLKSGLEILVVGKILLFYSPRLLLDPLLETQSSPTLTALAESEESPHKGFPVVQNRHGTFMYHIKNLFLLDKYEQIKDLGDYTLRVDLRDTDIRLLEKLKNINSNIKGTEFKDDYPLETTRGYFQVNKTDVLFKKLKNYRIQRKDSQYVGEVMEAQKSELMAIYIKSDLKIKVNDELKFITPEGKEISCKVYLLKDANLDDIESAGRDDLAIINYKSGVWVKSQVYLN